MHSLENKMGLMEILFPQQAAAIHLRELADKHARTRRFDSQRVQTAESRLGELEKDLGFVVLVLGSILDRLNEKGMVTRDEVRSTMSALDLIDGVKDGRLDINVFRSRVS